MDKLKFAIISIVGLVIVTLVLSPAIVPIQFWVISVLLTTLTAWKLSQKNNQSSSTPSRIESVTINSCDGMNQLRRANFNEEGVSKILNEYYHKLLTYSAGKDSYMALIIDVEPEVHFVQASGDNDSFVVEASANDLDQDVSTKFVRLGWIQAPHGNFCPKEGLQGAFSTQAVGYHEGSNEYLFTAFLTGYLLTAECSKFVFETLKLYGTYTPESAENSLSYRIFF